MQEFILSEGVLNDNTLLLPSEGKVFKGNYVAIIREYTYQNSWSNREKIRRFRSEDTLNEYLQKKYPNFKFE